MLTLSVPVMFRIVEDETPPLPEEFSESLQAFLKWCFNKDPAKRPDAEELFEHEWLMSHSAAHKVRGTEQDDGVLR